MTRFFPRLVSFLIGITILITPLSMNADNDSQVRLKVLGGLSYSTLTGEKGVFGPTAGGLFDIRVSSLPVFIDAGIEYMNKGYHNHSNHSFVIPCLGSYHLKLGDQITIEPFAGPAVSYGFNWKNWDCGLRLGCNLRVARWDFSIGYDLGFRHYSFNYAEGRNNSLFINAGYNFNLNIN